MAENDIVTVPYVSQVLLEQDAFRAAGPNVFPRAVRSVARPVSFLTNRLIPGDVIEAAIRAADWAAASSIRKAAVQHDFDDLEACDEAAAEVR
ncbi:MAG: hypothetical protein AAGJ39_15825, partial [Pseudomonadota bacterium]